LTSGNYPLHRAHPEVVLGPGAVFERVGFFAFRRILGKGRPPPDVEMDSRGSSTLRVERRRNGDG
jgi:hypothetical protein